MILCSSIALFLLTLGTYAIFTDDMVIGTKRGGVLSYHGKSAWLLYGANCCCAFNLLSVVLYYYDRNAHKPSSVMLGQVLKWLASAFCIGRIQSVFVTHFGEVRS